MSLQTIHELLNTGKGTEGSLLIVKKIHDTMVGESEKDLIPRTEARLVHLPGSIPGSSLDIDRVTENTLSVREIPQATEIPIDEMEYSSVNVKPLKYGVGIRITRELMEDAKWNILQQQVSMVSKRMAEKENELVIAQLDTAANTVSGGASVTIANITRAMQYLEDDDKEATTYLIGKEVVYDIRNIDTFVEADKAGNTDILRTGFVGTVYGMRVHKVSTNAGMTTTSSYVIDKNWAYDIVIKRPLTVEGFNLPAYDMEAASVTMRMAAKAIRTSAMCKITSS